MLLASMGEYAMDAAAMTMVGVWDTVGALGIPAAWGGIDTDQYGFLNTSLSAKVLNGYQALAIDEQRLQFPPTLWNAETGPTQVMEQTWFAGVHCDVGGGYAVEAVDNGTRLADMSLAWMVERAQLLGLVFAPAFLASYTAPLAARYALDVLHDSRVGGFALPIFPATPREIDGASILADSVALRCGNAGSGYAPGNLTLAAGVPAAGYNVARVVVDPVTPPWPGW